MARFRRACRWRNRLRRARRPGPDDGRGRSATRRWSRRSSEVGLDPETMAPLSARILRRPAPAHRHRARAHPEAQADRAGRADLRARHVGAGADRRPACAICRRKHGFTYLFISHDLRVIRAMSDRVIVMRGGKVVETGSAHAGVRGAAARPTPRLCWTAALHLEVSARRGDPAMKPQVAVSSAPTNMHEPMGRAPSPTSHRRSTSRPYRRGPGSAAGIPYCLTWKAAVRAFGRRLTESQGRVQPRRPASTGVLADAELSARSCRWCAWWSPS